ncbi:hypothetical protein DFR50_16117, partial [Roseiarcus fermentans]
MLCSASGFWPPTRAIAFQNRVRRAFLAVFLHDVQDHVAENGEIFGTVAQTAAVL